MPYADKKKQREYQKQWMFNRRKQWFDKNGPCALCESWTDLQLDHKNRKLKVSHKIWSWRKDRREKELAKCRPLCKTCHQERHVRDGSVWPVTHGTRNRYYAGCRCPACTAANTKHCRELREKRRARAVIELQVQY